MSVLALERYPVSTGAAAEFEALLAGHLGLLRTQPGLLWADGGRTGEASYVVWAEWRTVADLDAWDTSPTAAAWEVSTDPHLAGDVSRRRFDPRNA